MEQCHCAPEKDKFVPFNLEINEPPDLKQWAKENNIDINKSQTLSSSTGIDALSDVFRQRNELEEKRMKHELDLELIRSGKKGNVSEVISNEKTNSIVLSFVNKIHAPVRDATVVVGDCHEIKFKDS